MTLVRFKMTALVVLLGTGVIGCSGGDGDGPSASDAAPPGYCSDTIPCTDDERPFCDVSGIYPDSQGMPNTCIPEPPPPECTGAEDCEDEANPVCNSLGACVECLNFSHCNTTNPVCAFSTYTCGPCRFGEEGDSICEAIDIFQPFCGESGSCVECLDNSPCQIVTAPICDPEEFRCRGCENSKECDSGTCNEVTGVCEATP